jgi:hypothetical protein
MSRCRTPATRFRSTTSWPPPRPARTWPATTACATAFVRAPIPGEARSSGRCMRGHGRRGSAPRSSAGSCWAPTC